MSEFCYPLGDVLSEMHYIGLFGGNLSIEEDMLMGSMLSVHATGIITANIYY